ncbi:uncharacterized protein LOC130895791 [Diorhabda carinulata]|uniref:uncharacterized protein LOC130895791 n=1 Tax=Diorhabda carinulata TaxID=1163345 RepID=UPI0025A2B92C|nr:uncharacterized protein LOC130895791 [Diorhabda carinulata]
MFSAINKIFGIKMKSALVIIFIFSSVLADGDDPIVQLNEGKIRGHVLQSYGGQDYYAFQEIPYAAPPIDKNRFQLPKSPEAWEGTLETTRNTKVCQQHNTYSLNKTEDCLYLNVYSPVKPGSDERLPVLFWIHGGGLNWGSGTYNDYGPKYIMDYNVVVVAINYRLYAFGFASTDDDVIPGNLGLKDQRFALEWVNKYIHLFGGDPNHVTIAGESSGSAAVGLLVMGNWNGDKELFHAAIMESGSMIGGTLQKNAKENIIGLAKYLDPSFSSEKSEDILELLQNASAEDILAANRNYSNMIEKTGYYSLLPLQSFMDADFKKVPLMIGFNSEEWISYVVNKGNTDLLEGLDNDPSRLVHPNLNMSPENRTIAGRLLKKVYTNQTFMEDFAAYIRWSSDQSFSTPTGKQIELGSVHAPYYVYQFSYKGELGGKMDDMYIVPGAERVAHMEDLHYWWEFSNNNDISIFPDEDQLMMRRFLTLWTNFIKYYNPTPEPDPLLDNIIWPLSNPDTLTYLNINDTFEIRENPRVYRFVKPIFEKYMEPPYVSFVLKMLFPALCAIIFLINPVISDDGTVVTISNGKIRGHILKSGNGEDYYAFQEIPYATPPLGKNRFQLAKEPENWEGILNTTKNTKICYQGNYYPNLIKTEDCLYINVYTPVVPGSDNSLPVLFWIHGGGFNWGSGTFDDYGPKYLMGNGIVVVSPNYRLNAFGFMTTEDDVIPGNLGMKDVQLALRWVNKNIHLFGGNPNQVIIAGESCGSMGVGMLLMGPWSDGIELFHGAIMESSSQLGGVYQLNARQNAFDLGRVLNSTFNTDDSKELLEVLQRASTEDVYNAKLIYGTVTEKEGDFSYPALQAFMDKNFKKIPVMIGINSEERIALPSSKNETLLREYDDNPSLLVSSNINMSPEDRATAGKLLHEIYTDKTFVEDFGAYIRWSTDNDFTTPTGKQVQLGADVVPYYLYQFSYKGDLGGNNSPDLYVPGAERVAHMEELHYYWVFLNNDDLSIFPEEDQLALHRMVRLWTNFVKYLNPTPVEDPLLNNVIWPRSTPANLEYLNINNTLEVRQHLRQHIQISEVLDKYMKPPYNAYGH